MEHIAQVNIPSDHWIGYHPWFWIKNFGPKDFDYSDGVLTLKNSHVIAEFYDDHPNLAYTTVKHPDIV
jgi:hypothetical protein